VLLLCAAAKKIDAKRARHINHSERAHRNEETRHKKTPGAERKSEKKSKTDRGSWIEDVVRNQMRDVAHRYEAQRIRKLSGPISRGPPLVMRERARTHAPYMHAGAEPTFSRQEHTLCRVGAPCARLVPQPRESWFCPLTRVRATRNNRFYTCETRRQCPRASRILLKLPRGIAIPIDRHPNPPK